MKRALLFTALSVLCLATPGFSQSLDELRKEVVRLRGIVDPLAQPRLEPAGVDLRADITMAPVVDLINAFAAQSDINQKSVKLDFLAVTGNFYDHSEECKIGTPFGDIKIGDRHYYANIPSVGGFHIYAWLTRATAQWTQTDGLKVDGHIDTDIFVPTVHGHIDATCIGGGFGFDVGPGSCSFSSDVSGKVSVGGAGQGPIEFVVPSSVTGAVDCRFNVGELPDLVLRLPFHHSMELKGQLAGTIEKSGQIGINDPSVVFERSYALTLGPVAVSNWQRGIRIKTPIVVTFNPAP